jgi:hypothetical protein
MPISRRDFSSARRSSQSGLTRVEILVFAGLLVILGAAALACAGAWLAKRRVGVAVTDAHTLSVLVSQYATDNDGVYPVGLGTSASGTSEGIARNLLANSYTPDASIFALGSTARYSGTDPDFSDLGARNISWDFTAGATASTGITSPAPGSLPIVYTTGETVAYPTNGAGFDLPVSGKGPFGMKGVVVAYKGNNAAFIRATPSTGGGAKAVGFIPAGLRDPGPYTQVRP